MPSTNTSFTALEPCFAVSLPLSTCSQTDTALSHSVVQLPFSGSLNSFFSTSVNSQATTYEQVLCSCSRMDFSGWKGKEEAPDVNFFDYAQEEEEISQYLQCLYLLRQATATSQADQKGKRSIVFTGFYTRCSRPEI